jgi:hypothetical protein
MERDLHSGVFGESGQPHDVQLGSVQQHCRDVPYRHTMTGTLRLSARMSRINKLQTEGLRFSEALLDKLMHAAAVPQFISDNILGNFLEL